MWEDYTGVPRKTQCWRVLTFWWKHPVAVAGEELFTSLALKVPGYVAVGDMRKLATAAAWQRRYDAGVCNPWSVLSCRETRIHRRHSGLSCQSAAEHMRFVQLQEPYRSLLQPSTQDTRCARALLVRSQPVLWHKRSMVLRGACSCGDSEGFPAAGDQKAPLVDSLAVRCCHRKSADVQGMLRVLARVCSGVEPGG
jgi:hypothetical protein